MRLGFQRFWTSHRPHMVATISLAVPVVIGQLGQYLMGFIDSLMIGQLSYVHLSASSLANIMFFILTVIGLGVSFAISPLVAESSGAENHERTGDYLRQGTWVGLGLGLLIGLGVYFSADLLPLMDQPEEDVRLATSYTRILSISVIPMLLFLIFKQFTDGLSLTVPAMIVTLLGLGFNVLANWMLIFGKWGMPRLELDGAGWGTLASRTFMMLLMVGYVLFAKRFKYLNLRKGWLTFKGNVIKKILQIGIPSGLQYFSEVAAFGGSTLMIGWLENGSAYRAAHQIAIQMAAMAFMVVMGTSAAASIRVGTALGKHEPLQVRRAGTAGIVLAALFMCFAAITFILGRHLFPPFFTEDAFVLEIAANLMIIAAAFAIFDGIQAVGVGILRGMQDVNIPTLITIVVYWVINLPLGYALGFPLGFGITGIWIGFVVSLMLASGFLSWRFYNLTGRLIRQKVVQQVITADTTSTAPILPPEIPTQEPTPSG